jgi:hypothetical protein
MEVSGQLHALDTLLTRKISQYPLNRRLGGPQRLDAVEKILDPAGNRTPAI